MKLASAGAPPSVARMAHIFQVRPEAKARFVPPIGGGTVAPVFQDATAIALRQSTRRLTPREVEVVELSWMPNAEIAKAFGTSVKTVKCQMRAVMDKLGADSRTQAALIWERTKTGQRAAERASLPMAA